DDAARKVWRKYLADMPSLRVGIVWAGNPDHSNDHNRSVPREFLAPLVSEFGPHLLSLQNGNICRMTDESVRVDVADSFDPIVSTAALMSELDLVISVDTLPVHLAGALGVPVWALIAFDPDWRWFYGREDTPWYKTVRLFRQTKIKEWAAVIDDVIVELRKLELGNKAALLPPKWDGVFLTEHPQAVPLDFS
ncbi:MAG: glycosyltransferase family 9 protein, partial [Alphaproteobacteria bacterium]|nr:glycosyltransferase family 9 protein [Alphaproteobacteria bacterium]